MTPMRLVLAAAAALFASFAHAASPDDIRDALEARFGPFPQGAELSVAVASQGAYTGARRYSGLGLPEGFLALAWDRDGGRFAALVEGEEGPLRIDGTAVLEATVPVPVRRIARGETVSADDIELRRVRIEGTGPFAASVAEVAGREAAAPFREGRPIPSSLLKAPPAVRRNDEVTLVYQKGALRLTASGRALGDAAVGEAVKVSRPQASRAVEGVAVAEGVVMVMEGATR